MDQRVDAIAHGSDANGSLHAANHRGLPQPAQRTKGHYVGHHHHGDVGRLVAAELRQDPFAPAAGQVPIEQQQVWLPAPELGEALVAVEGRVDLITKVRQIGAKQTAHRRVGVGQQQSSFHFTAPSCDFTSWLDRACESNCRAKSRDREMRREAANAEGDLLSRARRRPSSGFMV
jgi:hypothetical protein